MLGLDQGVWTIQACLPLCLRLLFLSPSLVQVACAGHITSASKHLSRGGEKGIHNTELTAGTIFPYSASEFATFVVFPLLLSVFIHRNVYYPVSRQLQVFSTTQRKATCKSKGGQRAHLWYQGQPSKSFAA